MAGELGGVLFACPEAGDWGLGLMHSSSHFAVAGLVVSGTEYRLQIQISGGSWKNFPLLFYRYLLTEPNCPSTGNGWALPFFFLRR